MKITKIGLLCGLSWHSTQIYYKYINQNIARLLGPLCSANIVMNSLNADYVLSLLKSNKLIELERYLIAECKILEQAGVDYIAIACNSVHHFFDDIQAQLSIPLISITEAVKNKVNSCSAKNVGIIATKFSIENKLYDKAFINTDLMIHTPDDIDMHIIDDVICNLCSGHILNSDKIKIQKIIKKLILSGAEVVVLGCTELGLLITENTVLDVEVLDSVFIHSELLTELYISNSQKVKNIKSIGFS